jgi:hypothetical protein
MGRALTFLFTVALCSAAWADVPIPAGVYSTVSESEWEMELTLSPSHAARLQLATWEPGEGAHAKVETKNGEWRRTSDGVAIAFKAGTLDLRFDRQLSFAEFGRKGEAPGFVVTSATFDPKTYEGQHFWLKHELKKLKW